MTANNLRKTVGKRHFDARLKEIYLTEDPAAERARVKKVLDMYETCRADPPAARAVETDREKSRMAEKRQRRPVHHLRLRQACLYSAPGRMELAATTQTTSAAVFLLQVSAWT